MPNNTNLWINNNIICANNHISCWNNKSDFIWWVVKITGIMYALNAKKAIKMPYFILTKGSTHVKTASYIAIF